MSRLLQNECADRCGPITDGRSTPSILGRGEDFLLLEYVAHGPLPGTAEHGAGVGRALAEIHALAFPTSGFFGHDLTIAEPLPDWVAAVEKEVASLLAGGRSDIADLEAPLLASYERHAAELAHLALAAAFDLVNLVELLGRATPGSRQARDLRARIEATVQ